MLLGHFSARSDGQDKEARTFLDDALAHGDKSVWPFPIIKYLCGEIDEDALLAAANDNDKMTEARCFLGLDLLMRGKKDAAATQFHWVTEHGNPAFIEYDIALAELERLERQ